MLFFCCPLAPLSLVLMLHSRYHYFAMVYSFRFFSLSVWDKFYGHRFMYTSCTIAPILERTKLLLKMSNFSSAFLLSAWWSLFFHSSSPPAFYFIPWVVYVVCRWFVSLSGIFFSLCSITFSFWALQLRFVASLCTQRTYLIYLDEIALIFTLKLWKKLCIVAVKRGWQKGKNQRSGARKRWHYPVRSK